MRSDPARSILQLRRPGPLPLAGIAALALILLWAAGSHSQPRLTTNSELLARALHGALDSLLQALPVRLDAPVVILPAPGQAQDWALENQMAELLKKRVPKVTFHGALADTSPAQGKRDSTGAGAPEPSSLDSRPVDPAAQLLEYHVASLSVIYTDVHKSRIFGPGRVDRLGHADVGLRLLGPDGRLIHSAQGAGEVRDEVPLGRLREVEDTGFRFAKPMVPSRDLTRILEPAIVVGLVTGLVFLFYTNRN